MSYGGKAGNEEARRLVKAADWGPPDYDTMLPKETPLSLLEKQQEQLERIEKRLDELVAIITDITNMIDQFSSHPMMKMLGKK